MCAYVEAYQPVPDVSVQVDKAVKELDPRASGRAQAYGENCVYPDGHGNFSAMETDFYLSIHVADLTDDKELGTWIAKAMKALAPFAPGVVPGPESGFVEFTFKSGDVQRIWRVPIDRYKQLPPGLSGAELLKALFPNP